jgi:hypothetical protein
MVHLLHPWSSVQFRSSTDAVVWQADSITINIDSDEKPTFDSRPLQQPIITRFVTRLAFIRMNRPRFIGEDIYPTAEDSR